jgi:hypothetical protein
MFFEWFIINHTTFAESSLNLLCYYVSGLLGGGAKVFPLSENESDYLESKHLRILIVVLRRHLSPLILLWLTWSLV